MNEYISMKNSLHIFTFLFVFEPWKFHHRLVLIFELFFHGVGEIISFFPTAVGFDGKLHFL
jgi:hypothetical protein